MIELSKAWSADPRRPVWLQEVGAPQPHVPADKAADFTRATVANALDCPDLWGITWWCSHDVSKDLADFPELEYSLGLLTNDREPKPAGLELAKIVGEIRGQWAPPAPRSVGLVLDLPEEVTARATCGPGGGFYEAFMHLLEEGARPTAVLAGLAGDKNHLTARGITEVLAVEDVWS
jgi:hypothetical protein